MTRVKRKIPGYRWCDPNYFDNCALIFPKGYEENRKLRIELAVKLQLANDAGKQFDKNIRIVCTECRRRTKVSDIDLGRDYLWHKPNNSFYEGCEETLYYSFKCKHCGNYQYLKLDHPVLHHQKAFKSLESERQ